MLQYLKKEANRTTTENNAVTYVSTGAHCLDLYATIGALRHASDDEAVNRFIRAYVEDADSAMKILFFARDIRGGLGERKVFRSVLRYLGNSFPGSVIKNIEHVAEYGRFDDLLVLLGTKSEKEALAYLKKQLNEDIAALQTNEKVSLLGKWLPSINTSDKNAVAKAKYIAKAFVMSEKEYRQTLSRLRKAIMIIENNLRERDYSFDYAKQPSKALFKYKKTFARNDSERYSMFLKDVNSGNVKLNTSALQPYEIIRPIINERFSTVESLTHEERINIDATWISQENFTTDENAIVVVDGSASMYTRQNPSPISVAISLGIYFGERNKGVFHNHFITFSKNPRLVEIMGEDIYSRVHYCMSFNEVANTNIENVFKLILHTAVKNRISQKELPDTIYIISDMEFDICTEDASLTNFEHSEKIYGKYGYTLPKVVFWNVSSRNLQQPVKMNQQGVALVSGASPRVFSMISSGSITPLALMNETLQSERYTRIRA